MLHVTLSNRTCYSNVNLTNLGWGGNSVVESLMENLKK